jgi:hypothetical protein
MTSRRFEVHAPPVAYHGNSLLDEESSRNWCHQVNDEGRKSRFTIVGLASPEDSRRLQPSAGDRSFGSNAAQAAKTTKTPKSIKSWITRLRNRRGTAPTTTGVNDVSLYSSVAINSILEDLNLTATNDTDDSRSFLDYSFPSDEHTVYSSGQPVWSNQCDSFALSDDVSIIQSVYSLSTVHFSTDRHASLPESPRANVLYCHANNCSVCRHPRLPTFVHATSVATTMRAGNQWWKEGSPTKPTTIHRKKRKTTATTTAPSLSWQGHGWMEHMVSHVRNGISTLLEKPMWDTHNVCSHWDSLRVVSQEPKEVLRY